MHHRQRFILLITLGLIYVFAMRTILAQDNNSHGHGNGNGSNNGSQQVQPTQSGNNGNHQEGGNNGNGGGNGGNKNNNDQSAPTTAPSENQLAPTAVPQQETISVLGCQKNNPTRLDCSSLDVKGVCDSGTAIFIIHNSGEPGNGDMRAPTQYRLLVDGIVVETGSVQLAGSISGQVTYSGGGSVTLEVDQQVGHPGNSHPRVTLDCGEPAQTPTVEPTEEITPTVQPTETVTPIEPDLSAEVICKEDGSILFIITSNGGDMLDSAAFTVSDPNSNVIDNGNIQLLAGAQTSLQYWVTTGLTLVVSDLVVVSTPECVPSTPQTPPDVTPTVEPTLGSDLNGQSYCQMDGSILFVVNNYGSDMTDSEYYTVTDSSNSVISDGYAQILAGQYFSLYFTGYSSLTFTMGDLVIVSPDCGTGTPEPTLEVTPPVDNSVLAGSVSCQYDGSILFVITNTGESMPESAYYSVTDPDSLLVDDGWLLLMTGESTSLQYWGYSRLTLTMGSLVIVQDAECIPPTPEITPTPEPTAEPTQDVTPTLEPTVEVTPTIEPTETVTPTPAPTGTLGCQKNNPDRKDCSSLQVTGTCQDSVAVFTVRNTGKAGEGDMVSATQYRIIVDGVVVQTGSVQLVGESSIQITYSGTGTVTLEADQQTGHPGQSQPQATVSCSG